MSKVEKNVNFRLEISVEETVTPFLSKLKTEKEICDELKSIRVNIKRHVDGIDHLSHVMYDTIAACNHCGEEWTEANPYYNGGCCKADIANDPCENHEPGEKCKRCGETPDECNNTESAPDYCPPSCGCMPPNCAAIKGKYRK